MSKSAVDSILDSATTLFAEHGVYGVSLAEVAKRAKISSGLIIYHFKSKDNLLFIISRDLFSKLHRSFIDVAHAEKTPLDALNAFIDAFFSFAEENKHGVVFLARFDPFLSFDITKFPKAELRILKDQIINMFRECVLQGIDTKQFNHVSPDIYSSLMWSMLMGICHTYNDFTNYYDLCDEVKSSLTHRLTGSLKGA